ncbi:Permease component of ABC-transporter [Alloalcanivorax dieselolei B5]|uniref:Permease component of ABC-transporter n=1 Tax=Alcanivorax dieselolei (strain DSM 16502 / CGMCC 1.3690 / MCCC 1A00001 / B-5) TaxID=930169 RepID=K0CAD8_ALCDB|nr:Fe-S cluster assembly protein SufD [Alloalcanivorax dieselolei]AFT69470.1 Permease component of ABC-transporter [Alloalcanivorax dieselolei B5]GGJ93012.1 Fe-S cluster assembly protein SufD [Alloalcanivorax dieselolei]
MSLPSKQQGLELKTLAMANARRSEAGDALAPLRGDSLSALEAAVFPDRKTEQWKYTSLHPLTDGHLSTAADGALPEPLPNLAAHRLVMSNGRLQEALSQLPEGVTLRRQAGQRDELLTPFALYNGAALTDAITLEVAANTEVSAPLHLLLHAASDAPAHCQTRVEVLLNPGSKLTLIEHYIGQGPVLNNAVTVIEARDNASLTHYRLQSEREDTLHISTLLFRQTGASRIDSYQLMGGNRLRRNDVRALLEKSGAELNMQGVFVARGQSHIDNQLCVEHRVPHCTSNQVFKGLAGEKGKAILNGRIHIHQGAMGTLAELSNKNLLLSPGAEIYTKPELEIYNDDVKCAHGATVGQLDAAQQFYLQSRGIALAEAKRMLSLGFVNELILALPDESVAQWVQPWLAGELSQYPGANEEAA